MPQANNPILKIQKNIYQTFHQFFETKVKKQENVSKKRDMSQCFPARITIFFSSLEGFIEFLKPPMKIINALVLK